MTVSRPAQRIRVRREHLRPTAVHLLLRLAANPTPFSPDSRQTIRPAEEETCLDFYQTACCLRKRRFFVNNMALTKSQKKNILEELKEKIGKSKLIVLIGISGLKVKDISKLRKELKAKENNLQVAKKTLAELAFKENKLQFEKGKFQEEVALVFGLSDEIIPAKTVYQFSKENENLKILGGYLENKFQEAEKIIELAKLPTQEELLARVVGSLASPISGLANVFQGNIKGLVYVLSAIKK